jgi:prepilin peptidase CpaA
MIGFLFFFFGVLSVLGMCGLAAWTDFKGFRIPNIVPVIILASFIIAFAVTSLTHQSDIIFMSLRSHLIAFGIVFAVTLLMFAIKAVGAGDSKMMAAVALWLGTAGLIPFLFYMALTGGVLGIASLLLRKYKPLKAPAKGTWLEQAQEGANKVPYGIAIAVGTFAAFLFSGYFSPEKWSAMLNL